MAVSEPADSTFEWREVGAQVTIAALLHLRIPDTGRLVGRVLTEAMPGGAPVRVSHTVIASAASSAGQVTKVVTQTVGATRYFDAAGYPGRTLGLAPR